MNNSDLVNIPEIVSKDTFDEKRKRMTSKLNGNVHKLDVSNLMIKSEYDVYIEDTEMISPSSKNAYKSRMRYIIDRYDAYKDLHMISYFFCEILTF